MMRTTVTRWGMTAGLVLVLVFAAAGCASRGGGAMVSSPAAGPVVLERVAAAPTRTGTARGHWYAARGAEIQRLDSLTGATLDRLELDAPVRDLVFDDDRGLVATDGGAALLEVGAAGGLRVIRVRTSAELGTTPRRVAFAWGEPWLTGDAAVIRLSDGVRYPCPGDAGAAGPIRATAHGPVVASGRRLYRVDDGAFVGSASELVALPIGAWPLRATWAFLRRGAGGAPDAIGLMDDTLRECDVNALSMEFTTPVRGLVVHDGALWALGPETIDRVAVRDGRLERADSIAVPEARDVAVLGPGRVGVVGATGVHVLAQRTGDGAWRVAASRPAAGALTWAASDGRRIGVGGAHGAWTWSPGSELRPLVPAPASIPAPALFARTVWAEASAASGRLAVTANGTPVEVAAPSYGITCVQAIDGRIWIGHADGITILPRDPASGEPATVVTDGPVIGVFPRPGGGGGVYVTASGEMAVVEVE